MYADDDDASISIGCYEAAERAVTPSRQGDASSAEGLAPAWYPNPASCPGPQQNAGHPACSASTQHEPGAGSLAGPLPSSGDDAAAQGGFASHPGGQYAAADAAWVGCALATAELAAEPRAMQSGLTLGSLGSHQHQHRSSKDDQMHQVWDRNGCSGLSQLPPASRDSPDEALGSDAAMQTDGLQHEVAEECLAEELAGATWLHVPWCHHHVDQLLLRFEASYWVVATAVASRA